MSKNSALHQLDLSDREIAIYEALLKSGPASIRDIASRTSINRGTTYETLKQLANKGIVSYFPKGKRRFFMAEDPDRLLKLAERKQQALSSAIDQLQREIVPGLKDLKPDFSPGNVRFYEGDDGVELVLRDILDSASRSEDKHYAVISTKTLREHLYRPFPNFTKQRVALGINVKVIAIGELPLPRNYCLILCGDFYSAAILTTVFKHLSCTAGRHYLAESYVWWYHSNLPLPLLNSPAHQDTNMWDAGSQSQT